MVEPYISNAELFRELRKDVKYLRQDISEVRTELKATQQAVKHYNGLREELADCKERIKSIEEKEMARAEMAQKAQGIVKVVVAVVTLLLLIWGAMQ